MPNPSISTKHLFEFKCMAPNLYLNILNSDFLFVCMCVCVWVCTVCVVGGIVLMVWGLFFRLFLFFNEISRKKIISTESVKRTKKNRSSTLKLNWLLYHNVSIVELFFVVIFHCVLVGWLVGRLNLYQPFAITARRPFFCVFLSVP